MRVEISAHAIRRYAERALGVDTTAYVVRGLRDSDMIRAMDSDGEISIAAIADALSTPAVCAAGRLTAHRGQAAVKSPIGRILVKNGVVVTFLALERGPALLRAA